MEWDILHGKLQKKVFFIIFDGFWSKYDEFRPNQNFEISATFDLIFDPQDDVIEKFWFN